MSFHQKNIDISMDEVNNYILNYEIKKERDRFNIDIKTIICSMCSKAPKNEQFQLDIFDTGKSIISKRMDLFFYLNLISEFMALKKVLFKEELRYCFELMEKPKLHIKSSYSLDPLVDSEEKIWKLSNYLANNKLKSYEERILEIVPPSLNEFIGKFDSSKIKEES